MRTVAEEQGAAILDLSMMLVTVLWEWQGQAAEAMTAVKRP